MQKILFIGAGSMSEALIHGWITQNVVTNDSLYITNRSNYERLEELEKNMAFKF